jgi:hypothetical protein
LPLFHINIIALRDAVVRRTGMRSPGPKWREKHAHLPKPARRIHGHPLSSGSGVLLRHPSLSTVIYGPPDIGGA